MHQDESVKYKSFEMQSMERNPAQSKRQVAEKENDRCRINSRIDSKLASLLMVKPMSLFKDDQKDHRLASLSKSYSLSHNYTSLTYTKQPTGKLKNNTEEFCHHYGRRLIETDISVSRADEHLHPQGNFLASHDIDAKLRARMLDWVIEVASSYKFLPKTYFSCVQLLDRFFAAEKHRLPVSKLHIIGVVAILIATKMEEVFPLKLRTVFEKIVHRKIEKREIVEMEQYFSNILGFKLNSWTFFDLALTKLHCHSCSNLELLQKICSYVGKYIAFDYIMYGEESHEVLADTLVQFALDVDGQSCKGILSGPVDRITKCYKKLISDIHRFKDNFLRLENLFKFTDETTILKVEIFLERCQ